MPQAKEGNAMSEGTWENGQTRRRGKVPLLGRGEEEGRAAIGNSLCWSTYAHWFRRQGASAEATGARSLLLI